MTVKADNGFFYPLRLNADASLWYGEKIIFQKTVAFFVVSPYNKIKSQEELNDLKEEVESLNKKLATFSNKKCK